MEKSWDGTGRRGGKYWSAPLLSAELVDFLKRVGKFLETIEKKREVEINVDGSDDQEIQDMVNTALTEGKGKEKDMCLDADCSRVIEKCMTFAMPTQLLEFSLSLVGNFKQITFSPYGSHVIELLIRRLALLTPQEGTIRDANEEIDISGQDIVLKICDELNTQWLVLMSNKYGSAVMRTILSILTGGASDEPVAFQRIVSKPRTVPGLFKDRLAAIISRILERGQKLMPKYTTHLAAAPVLGSLLRAAMRVSQESCDRLGCLCLDLSFDNIQGSNLELANSLIKDKVGSHVIDALCGVCSLNIRSYLYLNCFRENLIDLATHSCGNFVLQRFLAAGPPKAQVQEIVTQLLPKFSDLLFSQRTGVLVRIAEASETCVPCQRKVVTAIESGAVGDSPSANFVAILVDLKEEGDDEETGDFNEVSSLGCLLCASLLRFTPENSLAVSAAVSRLSTQLIRRLAYHPAGSRLLEAFFRSGAAAKTKERLVKALRSDFVSMVTDSIASHVFEQLYDSTVSAAKRANIAEAIVPHVDSISQSAAGRRVIGHLHLDDRSLHAEGSWVKAEEKRITRKQAFDDMIQETAGWIGEVEGKEEKGNVEEENLEEGNEDEVQLDALFTDKKSTAVEFEKQYEVTNIDSLPELDPTMSFLAEAVESTNPNQKKKKRKRERDASQKKEKKAKKEKKKDKSVEKKKTKKFSMH